MPGDIKRTSACLCKAQSAIPLRSVFPTRSRYLGKACQSIESAALLAAPFRSSVLHGCKVSGLEGDLKSLYELMDHVHKARLSFEGLLVGHEDTLTLQNLPSIDFL